MEVNTNNGDKTYVYGDLYQYNIEKNEWKPVTSPNPPPREALTRGLRGKTGSSLLDLWRLDLNTNMCGWSSFKLKGCPGARSGHRLWQEIKPKLGAAWPSAGTGSQLAVYLDEIFLYGGYFKEPAPDKDQSDKAVVLADMWTLDPRIGSGTRYPLELRKPKSLKIKDTLFLYGGMKEVGKKKVTRRPFLAGPSSIIEETQSAWIEASKEKGETDGDNSDAGSINKGKDEEDDDEVVKKKDGRRQKADTERTEIKDRSELGLADSQQTLLPGETLRDFFSWTIMYWQMAPYDHTQHTGKELRKDGFDLANTRYRELKPVLDKLARLEADHNAEEEATKPSKERSKKKR
ncbi:hypothetical protein SELMODRAFT_419760 [Selaginella moellendorffii]|uniref:DUF4110 domain-containing protein n=1 Tax=Selaginella moellendorffii TaxID=88036 RepID=D8S9Y8_SELML|nr:hypothetical protein SELMODRAFT_419760 [Selaginella moellendorffii]